MKIFRVVRDNEGFIGRAYATTGFIGRAYATTGFIGHAYAMTGFIGHAYAMTGFLSQKSRRRERCDHKKIFCLI